MLRIHPTGKSLACAGAASLLLALPPAPARGQEPGGQEPIGVLTVVNGDWIRGSSVRSVGSGTRVLKGDTFRVRSTYTPHKYVTVLFSDGRRIRFTCPSPGPCPPMVPSDSLASGSLLARTGRLAERVRMGVIELFTRDPKRYSEGITRRGGVVVREAVLAMDRGGVDLAPALAFVPPGRYTVSLLPVPGPGAAADSTAVAGLQWEAPGDPAVIAAPALPEGLYLLRARPAAGSETASGWVLVVPRGSGFDHASREFAAAVALTAAWTGAGEGETRAFLRAVLEQLHRDPCRSPSGCPAP